MSVVFNVSIIFLWEVVEAFTHTKTEAPSVAFSFTTTDSVRLTPKKLNASIKFLLRIIFLVATKAKITFLPLCSIS